jgi:uncharacterized protein
MLAHVIPLAVNLFTGLGWIAALVMYFAYKDRSRFVAFHALQSAFVSLVVMVLGAIGFVLALTVVGLVIAVPLFIVLLVAPLVYTVIAAIRANEGQWYAIPIAGPMARGIVN